MSHGTINGLFFKLRCRVRAGADVSAPLHWPRLSWRRSGEDEPLSDQHAPFDRGLVLGVADMGGNDRQARHRWDWP